MDTGTTIWIDSETRSDLQRLAEANDRSMAGQIRWMVKTELLKVVQPQPKQVSDGDCVE